MKPELTVISVLHIDVTNYKRPVYSKMWIDRLYAGIKRNLDIPFRFVCMTNDIDPASCEYDIIPLELDCWGWWHKVEMWKKDRFTGPCLYIDADNVICKNITSAVQSLPQEYFLCPREPYEDILNGSTMFWNGDYSFIYDDYVKNQKAIEDKYKNSLALGEQGLLKDMLTNMKAFDDYVDPGFFGWVHHKTGRSINDPSVLVFTSTEKPTNNMDLDIVKNNWID